MKNLNQKDISFFNSVVGTHSEQKKLNTYIEAHDKAVRAYEDFTNEVLARKAITKLDINAPNIKPAESKYNFNVGDKVKLTDKCSPSILKHFTKDMIFTVSEVDEGIYGNYPLEIKIKDEGNDHYHRVQFCGNHTTGKIYTFFEKVTDVSPIKRKVNYDVNKKRKEVIDNARKYTEKKASELLSANIVPEHFLIKTSRNKILTVQLKDKFTGKLIKEDKAVCSDKYVFNGYIGVAIALSKLLDNKSAYAYFSNAPQPTIADGQYAVLNAKFYHYKHSKGTYVRSTEESDYVMLNGIKIKKGTPPENMYKIVSDDIAIY